MVGDIGEILGKQSSSEIKQSSKKEKSKPTQENRAGSFFPSHEAPRRRQAPPHCALLLSTADPGGRLFTSSVVHVGLPEGTG